MQTDRLYEDLLDQIEAQNIDTKTEVLEESSDEEGAFFLSMNFYLDGICAVRDDSDVEAIVGWIKKFIELLTYRLETFKFVENVCTYRIVLKDHLSRYEWDEKGYDEFAVYEKKAAGLTVWVDEVLKDKKLTEWKEWNLKMTFNADIHNCVPGFVLFKRFAMSYGFQHVKWIRGENSYMLIGRTGEEGELIKLPSYSTDIVYDEDTIADIEGICGKMLGREVEWGEVLRDIHYNNIEPILNDEFFPSEYGSCSSLNEFVKSGDVKVIGHFDKIGPTKDPNCYAFKDKKPVCDYITWFTKEGYKSQSTTQPWSCTFRVTEVSQKLKDFCENTPFTVYLINNEDEEKKVVFMLYDKMFYVGDQRGRYQEDYYSIALVTQRTGAMISWASALSCVTDTFEDAQHILIDFFGSLYDEEDEYFDEDEDEEYFDEEDEETDYTEEDEDDDRQ